jgi:hypothetical protein
MSEISQAAASHSKRKQDWKYQDYSNQQVVEVAHHQADDDEFTPSLSSKIFISNQKDFQDGITTLKLQNQPGHEDRIKSDILQGDLQSINIQSENENAIYNGNLSEPCHPSPLLNHHLTLDTQENDALVAAMIKFHDQNPTLHNSDEMINLLSQKVKEILVFAKSTAAFIKKRSQLEADYANNGFLTENLSGNYLSTFFHTFSSTSIKGKNGDSTGGLDSMYGGHFPTAWEKILQIHKKQDESRFNLSKTLGVVADNILVLVKNTERSRKQVSYF